MLGNMLKKRAAAKQNATAATVSETNINNNTATVETPTAEQIAQKVEDQKAAKKFFTVSHVGHKSRRVDVSRSAICEWDIPLGLMMMHIGRVDAPSGGAIAYADERNTYATPEYELLDSKTQTGVEIHEVQHVIRQHMARIRAIRARRGRRFSMQIANYVADMFINETMRQYTKNGGNKYYNMPDETVYLVEGLEQIFGETWNPEDALKILDLEKLYNAIATNSPPLNGHKTLQDARDSRKQNRGQSQSPSSQQQQSGQSPQNQQQSQGQQQGNGQNQQQGNGQQQSQGQPQDNSQGQQQGNSQQQSQGQQQSNSQGQQQGQPNASNEPDKNTSPDPTMGERGDEFTEAAQRAIGHARSKGWEPDMPDPEEYDSKQEAMSEEEQKEWKSRINQARMLADQIKRDTASNSKSAGSGTNSMIREMGADAAPDMTNWKSKMRGIAKTILVRKSKRTTSVLPRRFISMSGEMRRTGRQVPITPSYQFNDRVPGLVIINDTSASVTDESLPGFYQVWLSIQRQTGAQMEIVMADMQIQSAEMIDIRDPMKAIKKVKFRGNGGTDFTEALQHADRPEVGLIVYITDMCGSSSYVPKNGAKVIWAVPKSLAVLGAEKPPFGTMVELDF